MHNSYWFRIDRRASAAEDFKLVDFLLYYQVVTSLGRSRMAPKLRVAFSTLKLEYLPLKEKKNSVFFFPHKN